MGLESTDSQGVTQLLAGEPIPESRATTNPLLTVPTGAINLTCAWFTLIVALTINLI